jgi:magnesium transporter
MTTVIAFDFDAKTITSPSPDGFQAAIDAGDYCWIDIERTADAAAILDALNVGPDTIERIAEDVTQGQFIMARNCIHFTLLETRLDDNALQLNTLHVVLGEGYLATIHNQPSTVLAHLRETYQEDFSANAKSGGFLLFEIADYLIGEYRATLTDISHLVETVQKQLLEDDGDKILTGVSTELTRSLLDYRNAVISARETIYELATRRCPYVSETTQPYLDRQTISLERLAGDAATERTVLSEVLNLYMGIVSHRTNRVVDRLTIVSLIFLPLNFLAAVYGMNFESMPEIHWEHGYLLFWGVVSLVVTALILLIRYRRWI